MHPDGAPTRDRRDPTKQTVSWLLIGGLLFLRFALAIGGRLVPEPYSAWLDPAFQIPTYLLTAALIWWHIDDLSAFHVDGLAILVIALFKPVQTVVLSLEGFNDMRMAWPHWPALVIWVIALCLCLAVWRRRPSLLRVTRGSLKWLTLGAGAGVATAVLLGYPASLQVAAAQVPSTAALPGLIAESIPWSLYQIGYAAISEEPLFRGFLWGHLRQLGWRHPWILLFQTGLFTLAHIYYLPSNPISFWIIVPVSGLVLGALAWRSRSIATSMAAHGMMNAFGFTMGQVFAAFRT